MATLSKQDRQGARTPADLEQRYKFGKSFADVMGIATDAQQAAQKAASGVDGLDEKLDQDEIFNRLTNNGQSQGIYRGDDGELYINATYIKSGELVANLIKSGVITSAGDGESLLTINLDNGHIYASSPFEDNRYVRIGGYSMCAMDGYCYADYHGTGFSIQDEEKGKGLAAGVTYDRAYICGLTEPVGESDAVNKAYVDALERRVAALEAAISR